MSRMVPVLLVLGACAPYRVPVGDDGRPENAHYVVARGAKLYDCMSMPDGTTWNPTCVRVTLTNTAPDVLRASTAPSQMITPVRGEQSNDEYSLITFEMSQNPDMRLPSRGPNGSPEISEGPKIEVLAPTGSLTKGQTTPVKVSITPGENGLEVNRDSLEVKYLKAFGFDLTHKVLPYFDGTTIDVPPVKIPGGTHRIELYIEDMEGNASSKITTVEVE